MRMMMENQIRRKLAKEVADFYKHEGKMFSSKRTFVWNVMDLLTGRLKPGDLVVDVGAGNGRLADILPPDVRYLGVEPSQTLREEAQKNLLMSLRGVAATKQSTVDRHTTSNFARDDRTVVSGSLPSLELSDQIADAVACIAVLHHIPSREWRAQSVNELHRMLKPGGLLLCTVWNLRSKRFWSWQMFKNAWLRLKGVPGGEPGDLYYAWKASGRPDKRFVHAFTLKEFKSLFDPAFWSIEKIGAYDRVGWCHWFQGRNLVACVTKK
ncbi:MAG: class I SAM-dependent methyltransferase [Patescibacteria group bacterium]